MYHDLGLVRDFNINPITLRRWLVSDGAHIWTCHLPPPPPPVTLEWPTLHFLVVVGFCRVGVCTRGGL